MLMSIRMQTKSRAEVMMYGVVGLDVDVGQFTSEIAQITAKEIDLRIHSDGGAVRDGFAMYDAIKRHPAKVTAYIDGTAASMASIIMLAADKVVANENSLVMIHNPFTIIAGDSDELRRQAELLETMEDQAVAIYTEATGMEGDKIREMMSETTWMNAQEALELGFIDEIRGESSIAAQALTGYKPNTKPQQTEALMSEETKDAAVEPEEAPEEVTEETAPEATEAAEAPAVEAEEEEEESPPQEDEPQMISLDKLRSMSETYGPKAAVEAMLAGGDEKDAEIALLKSKLAAKPKAAAPVSSTHTEPEKPKEKPGLTQFMKGDDKHFKPKR